jgi:uncharacterized protein (DUF58 family)
MRAFGPRHRRLQLSIAGRWFVALTIALGVIAMGTGNNVIYLIESLLLSGLILSGVLSERGISAIEFDIQRQPAIAGTVSRDRVRARNRRRFTLFAIEIGEWSNGAFVPLAYIPKLGGGAEVIVPSRQHFEHRGSHRWEALAVATSYPFGLARKIRIIHSVGMRLVWPENAHGKRPVRQPSAEGAGARAGSDLADAEVRPWNQDDDSRMIVWTLSAKGSGPVVRVRKSEQPSPDVTLDLRARAGPDDEFERRVRASAQPFYQLGDNIAGGTLTIVREGGERRRFHGRTQALNQLALAQPVAGQAGKNEAA